MNYSKVNKALTREFGAGKVELRKAKNGEPWEFTLWFLSDNPAPSVVRKAKQIVNQFEPSKFYDKMRFHTE